MDVKKTKVEGLDIIVTMMEDKPYYEIKYKEVGSDHFCIGYSSYRLDYVLEWKKQYFELVESEAGADQGWIPCSERLPEDGSYILVSFENEGVTLPDIATYKVDEQGNGAFLPSDCEATYASVGLFVNAWMPLPKPHREGLKKRSDTP